MLVTGIPGNEVRKAKNHRNHQEDNNLKCEHFHKIGIHFEKRKDIVQPSGPNVVWLTVEEKLQAFGDNGEVI